MIDGKGRDFEGCIEGVFERFAFSSKNVMNKAFQNFVPIKAIATYDAHAALCILKLKPVAPRMHTCQNDRWLQIARTSAIFSPAVGVGCPSSFSTKTHSSSSFFIASV